MLKPFQPTMYGAENINETWTVQILVDVRSDVEYTLKMTHFKYTRNLSPNLRGGFVVEPIADHYPACQSVALRSQ